MLPDFNYMPAEEMLYLKRDELMREFQDIRLIGAARESNPGLAERLGAWLTRLFHARQPVAAPRQSYVDIALKLAA